MCGPPLTDISSAVFQAGGLVVVLVEVSRKAYLASIVPVIVNAILNEHQIIVDIVAFVGRGDFPRSRLGEKQRGKILAGWVSRKMRTIAQFSIKGGDIPPQQGGGPPGTAGGESPVPTGLSGQPESSPSSTLGYEGGGLNRGSLGSVRSAGVAGAGSSLRNVEHAPQILEQRELEQQEMVLEGMAALGGRTSYGYQQPQQQHEVAEMPADEPAPASRSGTRQNEGQDEDRDGETPTKARHERERSSGGGSASGYGGLDFGNFAAVDDDRPPHPGPKPGSPTSATGFRVSSGSSHGYHHPHQRLPGVDGREAFEDWSLLAGPGQQQQQGQQHGHQKKDSRNSLPSRRSYQGATTEEEDGGHHDEEEDEWAKDAGMYMNLAGTLGKREV